MGIETVKRTRRRPFLTVTIEQAMELMEDYVEQAPVGELSGLLQERLSGLAASVKYRLESDIPKKS